MERTQRLIDEHAAQVRACGRVEGKAQDIAWSHLTAHLEEMEPEANRIRRELIEAIADATGQDAPRNPAYSDHDQDNAEPMPATFHEWLKQTLSADELRDLASHGADAGWPGLTYTKDCADLHDGYERELWDLLYDQSQDYGAANVMEYMASFNRADMADGGIDGLKNLVVWFAAEHLAEELADELDEESEEEEEEADTAE